MLFVVLLFCIITEFPPSFLYILEIFFDKEFHFQCKKPLHYPILFMYYLSGAFNFVVYITMSKNSRDCFLNVVKLGRIRIESNASSLTEKNNNQAPVCSKC